MIQILFSLPLLFLPFLSPQSQLPGEVVFIPDEPCNGCNVYDSDPITINQPTGPQVTALVEGLSPGSCYESQITSICHFEEICVSSLTIGATQNPGPPFIFWLDYCRFTQPYGGPIPDPWIPECEDSELIYTNGTFGYLLMADCGKSTTHDFAFSNGASVTYTLNCLYC